ncbi:MAG: hypothetical protein WD114_06910 [Phycisphaerales bacterium]
MLSLFAAAPLWCALSSVHVYQDEAIFPQDDLSAEYQMSTEGTADGGAYPGEMDLPAIDNLGTQAQEWIFVSLPGYGNASLHEANDVGSAAWHALQDLGMSLSDFDLVEMHGRFTNSTNSGILLLIPPSSCLGDYTNDGLVNAMDGMLFAQAYVAGDLIADLTGNGRIDVYDQVIFFHLVSIPHCVPAW